MDMGIMSGTVDNNNNNNTAAITSLSTHHQQPSQQQQNEQQDQQEHQQHQHDEQSQQHLHHQQQQTQQLPQHYQHPLHQLQQHAQQQSHVHGQSVSLGLGPGTSPTGANMGGDSLTCQWQDCTERCLSAEQLYEHVCERHVGRKSTNNLNLTCHWGNCRTATIKRDHITSHIRVHVPLKPHKCEFCGKAFKRPQDLKKHVKTHADDSVLLRSPDAGSGQRGMSHGGFSGSAGKLGADLRTLAATATGYYPDSHMGHNGAYPHPGVAGPAAYYSSGPPAPGSSYGPVYYPVNQPPGGMDAQLDPKRRAAFEALNDFFGDVKRRNIDARAYFDVSQRLSALQPHQLSVLTGYGMGDVGVPPEYQQGQQLVTATSGAGASPYLSIPLPNLRTKADLLSVDQHLDQLQATIYESANQAAVAMINQPGSHFGAGAGVYRPGEGSAQSPTNPQHGPNVAGGAAPLAQMTPSASADTPDLTPASTAYTAAQSPAPVDAGQTLSPGGRSNVYPTLPSVSAISENGYVSAAGMTVPNAATALSDNTRRYSGVDENGQAVAMSMPLGATSNTSTGDKSNSRGGVNSNNSNNGDANRRISEQQGLRQDVRRLALSPLAVDPSLRSPTQQSEEATPSATAGNGGGSGAGDQHAQEREQEAWVENIRTIEFLRQLVKDRLERGEFEHNGFGSNGGLHSHQQQAQHQMQHPQQQQEQRREMSEAERDAQSLYPVLRAVEGSD